MSQRHALLVAYGGGHMKMILPVARELQRRGWRTSLVGLTSAGPWLESLGVPHYTFRDFVEPGDVAALAHGERLAARMHNPASGMARDESVAYLGLSYQDLVETLGAEAAARVFAERERHAFLPVGVMERVIRRLRPNAVVATNSPKSERASLIAAQRLGIPAILLSDLFGVKEMYRYEADIVCVLSEITRANLVTGGVAESSIHVTGNPALDSLTEHVTPIDPSWRRAHLGVGDGERVVLWADQTAYWRSNLTELYTRTAADVAVTLDTFAGACGQLGARLVVRRHPSQPSQMFSEWVSARRDPRVRVADHLPLYPLLHACDAVATITSTVGMEAAMLGRPVLTVDLGGPVTDLPLAQSGLALAAADMDGVLPQLRRLLFDDTVRAAMQKAQAAVRPDGRAAARVASLVEEAVEARAGASAGLERGHVDV